MDRERGVSSYGVFLCRQAGGGYSHSDWMIGSAKLSNHKGAEAQGGVHTAVVGGGVAVVVVHLRRHLPCKTWVVVGM